MLKKVINSIVDFVYPKKCIHCGLESSKPFLCENCLFLFEFLKKEDFFYVDGVFVISVFENIGPMLTLQKGLMYNKELNKIAASFMVYQYLNCSSDIDCKVVSCSNKTKPLAYEVRKMLKEENGKNLLVVTDFVDYKKIVEIRDRFNGVSVSILSFLQKNK